MVVSGSAQAYPWGFPQYPLYGGQYAPSALARSPASIAQAMWDARNAIRAMVVGPPLVGSDQLVQGAEDWPNHLIDTRRFGHRPNNRYGENLYSLSGAIASPAQAVGYWAREARG
jgi:uncharacterized protein YkwD